MRPPAPRNFGFKLSISLLITAALAIPAAVVGVRVANRHALLDTLTDPAPQVRERGLNYLIRESSSDPSLIGDAAELLDHIPDAGVIELRNALEIAGTLDHPAFLPALLDQLDRLSPETFIEITRTLPVDEPATRGRVIAAALARLAEASEHPERRHFLIGLLSRNGGWSSPPVPIEIYVEHIVRGLNSTQPTLRVLVARQLGELPITQPKIPLPLIEPPLRALLKDDDAGVRRVALFVAAGFVPSHPACLEIIERQRNDPDPRVAEIAESMVEIWHGRYAMAAAATSDLSESADGWAGVLADLETQDMASADVAFDPAMPHLVRVAATFASRHAEPDWLHDTLRLNNRSAVRDLACVTLTQRFATGEIEPLILELLAEHDPDGRASAAILSGLTGVAGDAVHDAADRERNAATRHIMRVGLWMQGRLPELGGRVSTLLGREGLPDSTLLLALLHGGQKRTALDYIFELQDSGSADAPLELLRDQRWQRVLEVYLPGDAPPLSLGNDPAWNAERLKDFRAWFALHRHTLDIKTGPGQQPVTP